MSKIDTNTERKKVVTMMGDLREVVDLYMRNEAEVAVVEGNHTFSREYKDTQIENLREKARASVRNKFDSLRSNCEMLIEVLRANDNIYDFSDPEFASCIALLSAADKPLPIETILGIAGKFLGNRQALLALVEVAKGTNKDIFSKMIFNTESEMERLQERLIELEINFPSGILILPAVKDDLIKIVKACGEELTDEEKDLGVGYQEIVTMQMRAAMGLNN